MPIRFKLPTHVHKTADLRLATPTKFLKSQREPKTTKWQLISRHTRSLPHVIGRHYFCSRWMASLIGPPLWICTDVRIVQSCCYDIYSVRWEIVRSRYRNIRKLSVVTCQFPSYSIRSGFWPAWYLCCLWARLSTQENSQTENFKRGISLYIRSRHTWRTWAPSARAVTRRTPLCLVWMKLLEYFRWCACMRHVLIRLCGWPKSPATTNRSHITVSVPVWMESPTFLAAFKRTGKSYCIK